MADITDIEADDFNEAVEASDIPVVLEFWVRSCGFCKKFKPVYEKLPDVYKERVQFLRMNMLKNIKNLRLAEEMGVEQTPTTKVFCGGKETGEIVGFAPLEKAVERLNAMLDSKECRSQMF